MAEAISASDSFVIPQIFTNTLERYPLRHLHDRHAQPIVLAIWPVSQSLPASQIHGHTGGSDRLRAAGVGTSETGWR
jgi:hypothetical protein